MVPQKKFIRNKPNTCDAQGSRFKLNVSKYFEKKIVKTTSSLFSSHLVPLEKSYFEWLQESSPVFGALLCALNWQIYSANTYSTFPELVFRLSTCE
jgi:hypothetical protein